MDPTNGKLYGSQLSPLKVMYTDSVKRTYVSVSGTKVSVRGIHCGIRLKEKSEDNIPIVRFDSHTYPFVGDYFPFFGRIFSLCGRYFPLKGNNSPLIGITFGRNFSL